jgi:hypothetical protein
LSDYQRAKARLVQDRLELLEHELADDDKEAVRALVAGISRSQRRLRASFLE